MLFERVLHWSQSKNPLKIDAKRHRARSSKPPVEPLKSVATQILVAAGLVTGGKLLAMRLSFVPAERRGACPTSYHLQERILKDLQNSVLGLSFFLPLFFEVFHRRSNISSNLIKSRQVQTHEVTLEHQRSDSSFAGEVRRAHTFATPSEHTHTHTLRTWTARLEERSASHLKFSALRPAE